MTKLISPGDLREFRESVCQKADPAKVCVRICMTGCRAYGAEEVCEAFNSELRNRGLEEKIEIRETGCHGFCARAPVIIIDPQDIFYQQFSPQDVPEIVS